MTLQRHIFNHDALDPKKMARVLLFMFLIGALILPTTAPVYANTYTADGLSAVLDISVISVVPGSTVTVRTYSFPAGELFDVYIGSDTNVANDGVYVGTTNSGAGGSFEETYFIPDPYKGYARLGIRMRSQSGTYTTSNVFYNTGWGGLPGYTGIPTFSITDVVRDSTVTVQTYNFPAGYSFIVRMGPYGTLGLGGVQVGTYDSGTGASASATFTIPDYLKGSDRIAIRMDATSGGFYSYNWFWNNSTGMVPTVTPGGPTVTPGYVGFPTFGITAVQRDVSVSVQTNNLPPNQDFAVYMGYYGTAGVGGIYVTTFNSGAGGSQAHTFNIPGALAGLDRIAIRMESPLGYYAYNWFWNNTTGVVPTATPSGPTATPGPTNTPGPTVTPAPTSTPGYVGYPYFFIQSVVQNNSVTIKGYNFPANQDFTVQMGYYGGGGYGFIVDTFNSGPGGTITRTFTIPANLYGLDRIAIRMDSNYGLYAFNWFWNATATVNV
jgi:hypothetical protein